MEFFSFPRRPSSNRSRRGKFSTKNDQKGKARRKKEVESRRHSQGMNEDERKLSADPSRRESWLVRTFNYLLLKKRLTEWWEGRTREERR